MDTYQQDLLRAAIWVVGILGSMGLATVTWGIKSALKRMDEQDVQLIAIKELLQSELQALRDMNHALEVRVTRIEERCVVTLSGKVNHRD